MHRGRVTPAAGRGRCSLFAFRAAQNGGKAWVHAARAFAASAQGVPASRQAREVAAGAQGVPAGVHGVHGVLGVLGGVALGLLKLIL